MRLHRVPMGRALTSTDVARAVLYLSCEDSAGVTGTSLVIDGGHLAAAEWDTPLVTLPDDLSWVQSFSLQRGDLPILYAANSGTSPNVWNLGVIRVAISPLCTVGRSPRH